MLFDTLGFRYYIGYTFEATVSEGLSELQCEEAIYYYKIIFIKAGPCRFILNNKEFILSGTCAICINEKDQIYFQDVQEDTVKILWFKPSVINGKFNLESINNPNIKRSSTEYQDLYYIKQFMTDATESMKILSLHSIDSATLEYKLQMIKELLEMQNTIHWPCRSRSYIIEILFCLARQEENENMHSVTNVIVNERSSRLAIEVIYYLQSSYNQKITLERLVEEFHTNRTTLQNGFKKYTGQSVNDYLIQLRLMMASTLLRDTELPIDEICDRSGFSDISYFSKVFKKKLYCTPSEYRRINHSHVEGFNARI